MKFTTAEFTCVPDLIPLSIQPNVVGNNSADVEMRVGVIVSHYLPVVITTNENLYGNVFLRLSLRVSQLKFAGICQGLNVFWHSWLCRKRRCALVCSDGYHKMRPNPLHIESDKSRPT